MLIFTHTNTHTHIHTQMLLGIKSIKYLKKCNTIVSFLFIFLLLKQLYFLLALWEFFTFYLIHIHHTSQLFYHMFLLCTQLYNFFGCCCSCFVFVLLLLLLFYLFFHLLVFNRSDTTGILHVIFRCVYFFWCNVNPPGLPC